MAFDMQQLAASAAAGAGRRRSPLALVRKVVTLGFAVIQLVLVARIAMDLGYMPDAVPTALIVQLSDAAAAPVKGIAGSGFGATPLGEGVNSAMVAALAGWSIVQGVVWSVLGRFL